MRLDRDRSLFLYDYCHPQAIPAAGDDGVLVLEPVKAKCPMCHIAMHDALLDSYSLLYCQRCRGMLIAMDDLQPTVASIRSHRDSPAAFLLPGRRAMRRGGSIVPSAERRWTRIHTVAAEM
jgi:Zn-finger nucleic acid-binding protein